MRYLIKVSYKGSNYSGFQVQRNEDTIQSRLENSLSQVCGTSISIIASGRTDAGVSAMCQVCHFDYDGDLLNKLGYINSLLPRDIRVTHIELVDESFHARFSAKQKTYEYYFYVGSEIPIYEEFATNVGYNIDIDKMQSACLEFKGIHDFSSFCATNTQVQDKVREVYNIDIRNVNDNLYKLEITGNGFLYNMVRIIMGTLVEVGLGKIQAGDIKKIIESKNRKMAGKTISAKGLVLKNVVY